VRFTPPSYGMTIRDSGLFLSRLSVDAEYLKSTLIQVDKFATATVVPESRANRVHTRPEMG